MSSDRVPGRDLWTGLLTEGHNHRRSLYCWGDDGYVGRAWSTVLDNARNTTAGLRKAGVRPGTRVAAVLTNCHAAVEGLLGVWQAGGALASLPVPARGMNPQEYTDQLLAICDALQPEVFLMEGRLLGMLPAELTERVAVRSFESFAGTGRVDEAPPGLDEPAFVQYSSGSTSAPKGCVLTPTAIAAQLDIVSTMLAIRPGVDSSVSWLPLSHDMGLFGCLLTCLWNDMDDYLSTPERFMFSPGTWFSDMAKVGATMTAGSNTGLYLAARSASRVRDWPGTGLSQVRSCIVGAERVEAATLSYVGEVLGAAGFRASALMPAYGLAEATLAVTATPLTAEPTVLVLDTAELADGNLREVAADDPVATSVVSAGVPCAGVELLDAPTDALGEILVRSPALASGYLGDPERTAERFRDGAVHTGDLGFVRDGQLFPVGRADDVISVAGRKVYSREIENAVDALAGVRRGCTTLLARGQDRTARLTLLIEVQRADASFASLADQAAEIAMAKAAVALDECIFLPRNSLPKTPSGKTQRHRCDQLLRAGRFDPLATIELARG